MQHRASRPVGGRHRRTDPLPGARARAATVHQADDAARAYLGLLTSTAPLPPAGPQHRPPATAPADTRPVPRRRDVHSHRAPSRPVAPALFGDRGRYAVAAVAVAAGVGVAGVAAATTAGAGRADAVATTSHTPAAAHTELTTVPGTGTASERAYATAVAELTATAEIAPPTLGAVRAARKARPVPPAPPAPVVRWVDPMPGAATTSCFGPRWGRLHAGVDLASAHGTPIRAAGAGTVVRAGAADGYGNAVLIDHGNGYLTHYGHLSTIAVTEKQRIKAGDQIGEEGSTGHSTGPHLHFEVHAGTYKNPIEPTAWMRERGVDIGGCARD